MTPADVDRFFSELDRQLDVAVEVILVGGSAALFMGSDRATTDIDFQIRAVKSRTGDTWKKISDALLKSAGITGIAPQFAEDIDRWSAIALPSKDARRYKKFGKVSVLILKPELWAIGKLTRFAAADEEDLVCVLSHERPDPVRFATLLGQALALSPSSAAQTTFPRQVRNFFKAYAKVIWGRSVDPERLTTTFLTAAKTSFPRRRESRP